MFKGRPVRSTFLKIKSSFLKKNQMYKLCSVRNNFHFYINFILQKIKRNYILFNYWHIVAYHAALLEILWKIPQVLTRKGFWLTLEYSVQSVLQLLKGGNNHLVQGQMKIVGWLEQTKWVPIFFPALFFLYAALHCQREHSSYWHAQAPNPFDTSCNDGTYGHAFRFFHCIYGL